MNVRNIFKYRLVVFFLIIAALGLALVLIQSIANSKHLVKGTITLTDSSASYVSGDSCSGKGGYNDISVGTQVTIKDGSNNISALSRLDEGKASSSSECVFNYSIKDVPQSSVYQVEVSHRGALTYSSDDFIKNSYTLTQTLGS